jgi:hypothetical protein
MNPDPSIQSELLSYMGQLPADAQVQVVNFARTLVGSEESLPVGTPGKELLNLIGVISHEDCVEMLKAIEEGCGQIDPNEW